MDDEGRDERVAVEEVKEASNDVPCVNVNQTISTQAPQEKEGILLAVAVIVLVVAVIVGALLICYTLAQRCGTIQASPATPATTVDDQQTPPRYSLEFGED